MYFDIVRYFSVLCCMFGDNRGQDGVICEDEIDVLSDYFF